jgi:hypothetical protein
MMTKNQEANARNVKARAKKRGMGLQPYQVWILPEDKAAVQKIEALSRAKAEGK